MPAIQLASTFILIVACVAAFGFMAWMLFDLARSETDQLLLLSPNQILQGMAGR